MSDKTFRLLVRTYRLLFYESSSHRFKLLSIGRIPIYISYFFILAALYPLFTDEFQYIPVFLLALFVSVFIHEVGHALLAKKAGGRVDLIYVSPIHGTCQYTYHGLDEPPASIAYGGILAQALAGLVCLICYLILNNYWFSFLWPDRFSAMLAYHFYQHLSKFAKYFISVSFFGVIINLLPIQGLDGEIIWRDIKTLLSR